MVPSLISSIKGAGLVLAADTATSAGPLDAFDVATFMHIPQDIDGVLGRNGVLRFRESLGL